MKWGIWQRIKQAGKDFGERVKYVWKISTKKKVIPFHFYQFTKDYQLTESPYIIYNHYRNPTIANLEQLVLRKMERLTAGELSLFLSYHYNRFPGRPLEFLNYSKGLFEGKVQAMLTEDANQPASKYGQGHYSIFRTALSWLESEFSELNNRRLQDAQTVILQLQEENKALKEKLADLNSIVIEFNPALSDKEVADLFKQLSTLHFADGKPIITTPHRKLSQFLPLICRPFEDKKGTDSLRNYLSGADDKQSRYQLDPEKRRIHIIVGNK